MYTTLGTHGTFETRRGVSVRSTAAAIYTEEMTPQTYSHRKRCLMPDFCFVLSKYTLRMHWAPEEWTRKAFADFNLKIG